MIYLLLLLLLLLAFTTGIAFLIRRTGWSANKKKVFFTLIASLLFFPVLIPAGTIAAIPAPNGLFLVAVLFTGNPLEIPVWYLDTWAFSLPSLLITALIFRGIAAMIFFENKYR